MSYVHVECVRVLNDVNMITARVSVGYSFEYVWMDVHGTMMMIHIAFAHKRNTGITRVEDTRCYMVRH